MFYTDLKDKNQNQYVIKLPFLKPAFKELISYIYTGEVCELSKLVYNLLYAADHYQVQGLKSICENELQKILCSENASLIFQTAHKYQCNNGLISAAFILIKK